MRKQNFVKITKGHVIITIHFETHKKLSLSSMEKIIYAKRSPPGGSILTLKVLQHCFSERRIYSKEYHPRTDRFLGYH